MALLGTELPAQAAAAAVPDTAPAQLTTPARTPVTLEPSCSTPKKGDAGCFALRRTDIKAVRTLASPSVTPSGYGPADLQSAYSLPADGGSGQTVAIVDAYDDPAAEADLAIYRAQYGLPACTTANGCFSKVDEHGGTDYPTPDPQWSGEISLDLDMVSASAPNAHILLVEGGTSSFDDLGTAVDTAVALGAKYVSNSYGTNYQGGPGSGEDPSETTAYDAYYNHPGVAVVASSGDYDYGVSYPAASQYVTSVGGTSLVRDPGSTRGWSESVWSAGGYGPGSGCSLYEPKPAFQTDTGCDKRTVADVSAVADPATGVAVYQTYGGGGWTEYGGTSASSPIIAGVYASAGTPVAGTYPNSYPYAASGAALNDVTTGDNGTCTPAYLCTAGAGYDGPTGLGTPNGLSAFRSGPHGEVSGTITDSSTGAPISGAAVTVTDGGTAHTDAAGAYSLSLPVGSYDITVSAFGYTSDSATSVAITDGGTLTKDFALAPVPSQTVSGKVTDGSGHGWPLYAKITVDGVPDGPVWTDPLTGSYSMSLPQGHDYTLHVDSTYPGYESRTKTITVGSTAQTENLLVAADPWAATAPGYALKLTGTTEPFDSTDAAPQGWSVVNADGTTGGWEFDDPGSRGNTTGGDGAFAIVDSDHYGSSAHQDSQLISPAYDFTDNALPEVSFNTNYRGYPGQTAAVDASTDGGATWTNAWSSTSTIAGPGKMEIPLTDYAGKPAVQLRFHFTSTWGYWWELDNVFVGQRDFTPTPGGLLTGTVTDANTSAGLVGATVTSQDRPAQNAVTLATPDDPNIGDGFYSLFSSSLGAQDFTTAKARYAGLTKTVNVNSDSTVDASFALQAGQLSITPGSVSASVGWGGTTTQKLTVKNTGGATATAKLGELAGGFDLSAATGAPKKLVKGDFSPLSSKSHPAAAGTAETVPGAAGDAWQAAPDLPQEVMDNAVGTYDGKVYSAFGYNGSADSKDLYSLDPVAGTWTKLASAADTREDPAHGFIDGKFYAAGGWGPTGAPDPKLEIYDPESDSWTTGASAPKPYAGAGTAVLNGKLYMVGGCGAQTCGTTDVSAYDPADNSWSQLAAYPEQISWNSCAGIDGKLYCGGGTSDSGEVKHAYVYDPGTDSWSPIADMPISLWGSSYTSANGLLLASSGVSQNNITNQGFAYDPAAGEWTALPNADTGTYRGGGSVGFFKVGGADAPSSPVRTVELLPGYDQEGAVDVSWLSESTQQLTLQPGETSTVTLTLDSSGPEVTQPGDFSAQLAFSSDDTPYPVLKVPVALHVAPPKTWGKITGTVLGVTAAGGTAPLGGATVQINGKSTSYTLTTGTDGGYALWLDVRDNPLSVIVAKDGFQPTVATVKVSKETTVTKNFTLRRK